MIRCFFSCQVEVDAAQNKTLEAPSGTILRKTHVGKKWISSIVRQWEDVNDMRFPEISSDFRNFCETVLSKKGFYNPGINFWLSFSSAQDVHGLALPSKFIADVSNWRPWIDIAVAVNDQDR